MATILLVEDDYALAMGTEYMLQAEGYDVLCACNLKEARELVKKEPDLILLDVMLPDGTGYEFCKEVRDGENLVPIIFLTAVSEEVNIVQGLELGADDYIAKPYRVKELLSRIGANLRRSQITKGFSKEKEEKGYSFGKHIFYFDEFRLLCEGVPVECTNSELRLLKELIKNEENHIVDSAMVAGDTGISICSYFRGACRVFSGEMGSEDDTHRCNAKEVEGEYFKRGCERVKRLVAILFYLWIFMNKSAIIILILC